MAKETIHDKYMEFPTLHTLSVEMENTYHTYKDKQRKLKKTDRYNQNEIEREYQLKELKSNADKAMADIEARFKLEMEVVERTLADQAFSTESAGSDADIADAKKLVDVIKAHIVTSSDIEDTVALLAVKVKSLTDVQKVHLAQEIGAIEQQALAKAVNNDQKKHIANAFSAMSKGLPTASQKANQARRALLAKIKESDAGSLLGYYKAFDNAIEHYSRERKRDGFYVAK